MTKHMSVALSAYEELTDEVLLEVFEGSTISAHDIRETLKDYRAAGYKFFPCSCANHAPDGSCLGVAKALIDHRGRG